MDFSKLPVDVLRIIRRYRDSYDHYKKFNSTYEILNGLRYITDKKFESCIWSNDPLYIKFSILSCPNCKYGMSMTIMRIKCNICNNYSIPFN